MKKMIFRAAALLLISCVGFASQAQTVDEVINNHVNAIGGAEKWKQVNSIKVEGHIEVQGVEISFSQQAIHNVGVRVDAEFQGMQIIDICTPTKGWMQNPFGGQSELEEIPAEQHKLKVDQLDLQNSFVGWKEKGSSAELIGKVKEGKNEVFKIKMTTKAGKVTTYYFDATSYLLTKSEVTATMMGEEMTVTTEVFEYKELPIGIKVPFKTEQMGQAFIIDKYEVNVTVDPKIFEVG
jgi:hypothetical protein